MFTNVPVRLCVPALGRSYLDNQAPITKSFTVLLQPYVWRNRGARQLLYDQLDDLCTLNPDISDDDHDDYYAEQRDVLFEQFWDSAPWMFGTCVPGLVITTHDGYEGSEDERRGVVAAFEYLLDIEKNHIELSLVGAFSENSILLIFGEDENELVDAGDYHRKWASDSFDDGV